MPIWCALCYIAQGCNIRSHERRWFLKYRPSDNNTCFRISEVSLCLQTLDEGQWLGGGRGEGGTSSRLLCSELNLSRFHHRQTIFFCHESRDLGDSWRGLKSNGRDRSPILPLSASRVLLPRRKLPKKTTSLATKATTTTTSTVREPKFWGHVLVSVTRRTNISHGDFLLHSLTPSHPLPTLFTAYHKPDTI